VVFSALAALAAAGGRRVESGHDDLFECDLLFLHHDL